MNVTNMVTRVSVCVKRTLSWKTLQEYGLKHANARASLREWFHFVERVTWENFSEVNQTYASADSVGDRVIFNIKGNSYRLLAIVNYESKYVLIRWIGTHAEYTRLTEQVIKDL